MKKILSIAIILLVISVPASFAQEVTLGEKARQKSVEVTISETGDVHVKHIIANSFSSKQVDLIDGVKSNLTVQNEEGEEQQHAIVGENDGVLIFPSDDNVIVEYDLSDVVKPRGNGWIWKFFYPESTAFFFPDNLDVVFANQRAVYIGDQEGMMCHGCQVRLEYTFDEPKSINTIIWEDKKFDVVIRTHAPVSNFNFDQPSKSISFSVESESDFVTTIIPLELLWGPYQVFMGDEKIFFSNYNNNGTHVWLNFRPDTSGDITIIGTTVIPEFPVAILVLSLSIIAIIPLARKFNLR